MLRGLSLTSRLTLFFTVVAATVVIGLGWLLMAAAERHFMELDRIILNEKKYIIKDIFTKANSLDDMRWRLNESLNNHHGLLILVKKPNGEDIFQSENVSLPNNLIAPESEGQKNSLLSWKIGTTNFHAINYQSTPKYNPSTRFNVTVAIDTKHHLQFLSDLQRSLAIYAMLATLISGLLGWIASHRGMAPLRTLKKMAAEVSAHRMEERMPVNAVPVEMAELAIELNLMLDRLQQDFRRLSEFASDLAHELRTPISNLLTQTQVTLSAKRDADTYRGILVSNAEELQRMARMVSDMLFLAKTERGVDLPNQEHFSAAFEVQALLDFYEAVADEKKIHLRMIGDGSIQGDRLMFRRAVSNLLSNALRHTPSNGEVLVSILESPLSTKVAVEDTGKEIDPVLLPRLFDRFYRSDPSRAHPDSEGSGLGLSITKAIVEAHAGKVTAKSGEGKNTFGMEFPKH
jgi:two-component system heavy metal sensor histidine kinase CusS